MKEPRAVVKIEMIFSKLTKNAERQILLQRTYAKSVHLNKVSPDALTGGWNQALRGITAEFENDLKATISCQTDSPSKN